MATSPVPSITPSPATAPKVVEHPPLRLKSSWQKYGTPLLFLLLAIAVIVTIIRNWNGWEGSRVDQVTNDAYVRGDLTPLSTKVPGLVRDVKVNDYQQVHKGDVLVQLDDDDYKVQVAQAVDDEERFSAQYASRDADLAQAYTLLRSNEAAL